MPLAAESQVTASEKLGIAIDYFQGGKYHEALLIMESLSEKYELNPRHRAYMGVCYYYDWQYDKACMTLDSVMSQLEVFAPHERSVYYFTDAESHFELGQYREALPLYEQMTLVCHDNEKADALYRMGFCYLNTGDKENALEFFSSSLAYYLMFPDETKSGRMAQIRQMIAGLAQSLHRNN